MNKRYNGAKAGIVTSYTVKEDISTYMSSPHMWTTLAKLLDLAFQPLSEQTTITDDMIHGLIFASMDKRRKTSPRDTEQVLKFCFNLLKVARPYRMRELIYTLGIDRGIFSQYAESYLSGSYVPLGVLNEKDYFIEDQQLTRWLLDYYRQYFTFRNMVANRYVNLVRSEARKNKFSKDNFGMVAEGTDHDHNYMLSLFKAIDKFYPGKGTLTKYVQNWLQNAPGSTFTVYVGESFQLSRTVRRQIHIGDLNLTNKSSEIDETVIGIADTALLPDQTGNERDTLQVLRHVMGHPSATLAFVISGFALEATPEILDRVTQHSKTGLVVIPKGWVPPLIELSSIPELKLPVRARRQTSLSRLRHNSKKAKQ